MREESTLAELTGSTRLDGGVRGEALGRRGKRNCGAETPSGRSKLRGGAFQRVVSKREQQVGVLLCLYTRSAKVLFAGRRGLLPLVPCSCSFERAIGQEGKFQAAAYMGSFNRVGLELHKESGTRL